MHTWYKRIGSRLRSRGLVSALVACAVVASPLLFAPIQIYSANVLDFAISMSEALLPVVWIPVVALLTFWLILVVIPHRFFEYLLALMLAIAVLFWAQGNVLVWDYGVLDGGVIDWWGQWHRGAIDGAIWLGVMAGFVVSARRLRAQASLIATLLLSIQAVAVGYATMQSPDPPTFHRYSIDDTHKYDFSNEKNIVLLVLDAFQADVMQEILDSRPEYYEVFDGFVFYRNAAAGYSKTYASIPLMLTGKWYENDVPIQDFIEKAFESSSVTKALVDEGWRVDLFPQVKRTVHFSDDVANNMVLQTDAIERSKEAYRLIDSALFRVSPHFIKPFWINDYQWRLSGVFVEVLEREATAKRDPAKTTHPVVQFVSELRSRKSVSLDRYAFKMYHLNVPHGPFMLNEKLNMERLPTGRTGFVRHSLAALEVARSILDTLKELGIYNDTTILIVSDHGGGEYGVGVDQALLPKHIGQPQDDDRGIISKHLESALPLMMIKSFGRRGRMRISDAPVSTGDLAATIAKLAGLGWEGKGRSILEMSDDAKRSRRYLFYHFQDWRPGYLPEITEYVVHGHSWLPQNWKATGRTLRSNKHYGDNTPDGQRIVKYSMGKRVEFNSSTPYTMWLGEGWAEPESWATWSDESESILRVPLAEAVSGSIEARLNIRPFTVDDKLPLQRIRVRVNGRLIEQWEAREAGWYRLLLPNDVANKQKVLEFHFELLDAAKPSDYVLSLDDRRLGIALIGMEIVRPSYYEPGRTLVFGDHGDAHCCMTVGWSQPETGFVWTAGHRAALDFILKNDAALDERGLIFRATVFPYLAEGNREQQTVHVYANGAKVGVWDVREEAEFSAHVRATEIKDNKLRIDFEIPDAVAPAAVTASPDRRMLGIGVRRVSLDLWSHGRD